MTESLGREDKLDLNSIFEFSYSFFIMVSVDWVILDQNLNTNESFSNKRREENLLINKWVR